MHCGFLRNVGSPVVSCGNRSWSSTVRGHYNYYGITGNSQSLSSFQTCVLRVWRKWLGRRNRERRWNWDRHRRMLQHYRLPPPTAVHSVLRHVANP